MGLSGQAPLDDLVRTGNIAALNDSIEMDLIGVSGGKAVVSGTWVGTIKFEASIDGNRWDPVGSFSGTTGTPLSQTGITSNDIVVFVGIAGAAKIRARFDVYTSGTATVTLRASNGVSNVFVDNLVPGNLKATVSLKDENHADFTDTNPLPIANTLRPSEVRNRVKKESQIFKISLTSSNSVIYTVTNGKTLYMTSFVTSYVNNTNAIGEWRLRDGNTDKISFILGEKAVGAAATYSLASPTLEEPISFTDSVTANEVSGDIQLSFYFIGYEE